MAARRSVRAASTATRRRFAERFRGVKGHPFEQGFDLRLVPEKLAEPLRWSEPRMIFVNSMSDLFHEGVPDCRTFCEWRDDACWRAGIRTRCSRSDPNVCGICLRTAPGCCERSAHLVGCHLSRTVSTACRGSQTCRPRRLPFASCPSSRCLEDLGKLPLQGISWVIVGGESGPGARPMKEDWVLSIREQCEAANIPFFFKQWGGVRKKVAGRRLLGRTHDGFPYRVQHPTLPARFGYSTPRTLKAVRWSNSLRYSLHPTLNA